jgi:hypothetical protein
MITPRALLVFEGELGIEVMSSVSRELSSTSNHASVQHNTRMNTDGIFHIYYKSDGRDQIQHHNTYILE